MADQEIIQHIPAASPQGIYYRIGQVIQLPNGKKYLLTENGWQLIEENPK